MTTKAIEAGARAVYESRNGKGHKPWRLLTKDHKYSYTTDAKACIEAAIASGELVPASAVAAERERCARLAEQHFHPDSALLGASVAKAIRALEPASGEYVLVPREPTEEMIDAFMQEAATGNYASGEGFAPAYRAMLTAATSNGSDPT